MDFISWLVVGVLFMLAEIATGTRRLLIIGLACIYPSVASFMHAPFISQLAVFALGGAIHLLVLRLLRKHAPPIKDTVKRESDIGQRVEIIEWLDETTARVIYRGQEWQADKARGEMPDTASGIIVSVQGSRLIISTE
jgi:membrane protein implicated in regulation of membrane protease activity